MFDFCNIFNLNYLITLNIINSGFLSYNYNLENVLFFILLNHCGIMTNAKRLW